LDITNKKAQGKGLRAYGAQMHEAGMLGGLGSYDVEI